jgi:hypothetical protein
MQEQPVVDEKSANESVTPSPIATPVISVDPNKNIYNLLIVCSLAMIGCFFLPWIGIFLGDPSGYQLLQVDEGPAKLVWLIPFAALLSLLATITKQGVAPVAQLAGGIPFVFLIYCLVHIGSDVFQALEIGACFTLFLGAIMLVAPRFLKTPVR